MMYLGNNRNLVREAVLSALNVVPSQVVYRSDTDEKAGGGRVSLSGDYTGANDATYDVEITNGVSSTPRVSAPVFSGIGNGTISALSATGLASQTITVSLRDLGIITRKAYSPFQTVTLRARLSGSAGNDITLSIDTGGLVSSPTDYATQGNITAGDNEYRGDDWNFGAKTLNPDGTIPDDAPRIAFGFDPQVYRAYREFKGGQYVYSFSPAPVRNVERGTPVYAITGDRTVTITDGSTTDTLPGIETIYDCLLAIESDSTLIEVDGVIANDKRPGGQAATELSVWTEPYIVSIGRDGTDYVKNADLGLSLSSSVPTQQLTIKCENARTPGREQWSVRGEVSGALMAAYTGVPYRAGGYEFTVPTVENPEGFERGRIHVKFDRPSENEGEADAGWRGAVKALIGSAGRSGSWTFVYRQRPPTDCEEPGEMVGGPNPDCLGITPPEDYRMSEPEIRVRRQRLARKAKEFVQTNTSSVASSFTASVDQDITFYNRAGDILHQVLVDLSEAVAAGDQIEADARQSSHAYALGEQITVTISGTRYLFTATTAGTSASSAPSFAGATALDATVSDGSVTWTNAGKTCLFLWDDLLTLLESDATQIRGMRENPYGAAASWAATTAFVVGNIITISTVNDVHAYYECTTAGTTGGTEPDWRNDVAINDTVTDGSVVWTRVGGDSQALTDAIDDAYYERYVSAANEIKAAAGLAANFDFASTNGDGCWLDDEEAEAWFEYEGDDVPYAPIIPNLYYHSSQQEAREDGSTFNTTTKEFAFGAMFGCPENLLDGDRLIITITGVSGVPAYQVGDTFTVQTTRATPLPFGGGQTGTDVLTWSVRGSVVGALADYALDISDPENPNAYSNGGLGLTITQGAIEFALGDTFTFDIESAQYRTRKNAGAWSSAADIPTGSVVLSDGLSLTFSGGQAPSWVAGDVWTFTAEAVNGVDQVRYPTDARLSWTGSTTLTVTPDEGAIAGLFIGEHSIASTATITLQGSDDDFASTPLNVTIPWREQCIWYPVTAEHEKYRVQVNESGSISWLWMGNDPLQLELARGNGLVDLGRLVKRKRLPGIARRAGLGGTVEHEAVSADAVDALEAMLSWALVHDDGRLGIVPNATRAESGVVEFRGDSLEVNDVFSFQPLNPDVGLLSVSLELEPIP